MRFTTPVLAALLLAPAALGAQNVPEKFENLKVLPKDISRDELTAVMRGFRDALGVRCSHCHVPAAEPTPGAAAAGGRGGAGGGGQEMNFKADDKPEKETARAMLKMVAHLNNDVLATMPNRKSPAINVTCATCHHGMARPQNIADVITETLEKEGVQAAITRYKEMRTRFLTAGMLDFRPDAVTAYATTLSQKPGRAADALALQKMNVELNPESASAHFGLGELYLAANQKDLALAEFKRTLELQPNNRQAQQRVRELGGDGQ